MGIAAVAVAEGVGNCQVAIFGSWCVLSKTFERAVFSFSTQSCRSRGGVDGPERTSRLRERSRLGVAESKVSPCRIMVRD